MSTTDIDAKAYGGGTFATGRIPYLVVAALLPNRTFRSLHSLLITKTMKLRNLVLIYLIMKPIDEWERRLKNCFRFS